MSSKLVQIEFLIPKLNKSVESTPVLVKEILTRMRSSGSIEYAGYLKDEDLERDLIDTIGTFAKNKYGNLTKLQKRSFLSIVEETVSICDNILPLPEKPLIVFVFPWFPDKDDEVPFGGVNAVAVHENVMHLFVSINAHTQKSLRETVAHEYNHLLFYHYQPKKKYSLREHILMEGLAEVFREEVVGGIPAPWAIAIPVIKVNKLLANLKDSLDSKSDRMRKNVLLGNEIYLRWTGYSIGYWKAKEFRAKHKSSSWEEIVAIPAKKII
jgi:uncharacterized protein YjaZ